MPKASELLEERPFVSLLFYGDSGTGKSTIGALAPLPFIALSEPQGLPSIAYANGEADVEFINEWPEFRSLMRDLKAGSPTRIEVAGVMQPAYRWTFRGKERVAQSLVIDSGTDVQAMCKAYIASDDGEMTIQDWGTLRESFRRVLDDLRRLPMNIVFLALSSMDLDDQKKRRIEPALDGSITRAIGQFFSGAAYVRKVLNDGDVVHQACFNLPTSQGYVTKPPPGWPDDVLLLGVDKPGSGTIGSLSLLGAPPGVVVAHAPVDSADKVVSKGGAAGEMGATKKKPAAARKRRTAAVLGDEPAKPAESAETKKMLDDELVAADDRAKELSKESGDADPVDKKKAPSAKGRRAGKKPAAVRRPAATEGDRDD